MGSGITIRVQGASALSTGPEMKVERVISDATTPPARGGVIEASIGNPPSNG